MAQKYTTEIVTNIKPPLDLTKYGFEEDRVECFNGTMLVCYYKVGVVQIGYLVTKGQNILIGRRNYKYDYIVFKTPVIVYEGQYDWDFIGQSAAGKRLLELCGHSIATFQDETEPEPVYKLKPDLDDPRTDTVLKEIYKLCVKLNDDYLKQPRAKAGQIAIFGNIYDVLDSMDEINDRLPEFLHGYNTVSSLLRSLIGTYKFKDLYENTESEIDPETLVFSNAAGALTVVGGDEDDVAIEVVKSSKIKSDEAAYVENSDGFFVQDLIGDIWFIFIDVD